MSRELHASALAGLPEIRAGDDLAAMIAATADLREGDVVVIAHKAVSKSEGAVRTLADVTPSAQALALATEHDKDPRHIQVILDQSSAIVRAVRGVLICRTHHGFVCANAGVDASNAEPGTLITLPHDPDASARALRAALPQRPAVVITDSFGRAWRGGQVDVAIGIAGLAAVDDWRGRTDARGRDLNATIIAIADEAAAAADLCRAKDSREPVILLRGLERYVGADDGPGARALLRPVAQDLFS